MRITLSEFEYVQTYLIDPSGRECLVMFIVKIDLLEEAD